MLLPHVTLSNCCSLRHARFGYFHAGPRLPPCRVVLLRLLTLWRGRHALPFLSRAGQADASASIA
jgi:hypothetical protein